VTSGDAGTAGWLFGVVQVVISVAAGKGCGWGRHEIG